MTESNDLLAEVTALRNQVDDVAATTEALLRVGGKELRQELLAYLERDLVARKVFELCDGERSQAEITKIIIGLGLKGGSAMGVSRRFEALADEHTLLVRDRRKGNSPVYRHTHAAKTLKISRGLSGIK